METTTVLMVVSAAILFALGTVHLIYTFWSPRLLPRDPALIDAMKAVSPVITTETTIWKAWIGFNASHSMAAILFGLVYGYLAIAQPEVLFDSLFLQAVGFLMVAGFVVLARVYWFRIPFVGSSMSLLCYVASIILARA